jgi:hypothetical protein
MFQLTLNFIEEPHGWFSLGRTFREIQTFCRRNPECAPKPRLLEPSSRCTIALGDFLEIHPLQGAWSWR